MKNRIFRRKQPQPTRPSGPGVVLELDRPRLFRFDTDGLIEIRAITGVDVLSPSFFAGPIDPSVLIVILWVGLKGEDPSLTIPRVGELLLAPGRTMAVARAIASARASGTLGGRN